MATTLFVEGTSVAVDVRAFYESSKEPGDYPPDRQTIWPKPQQYRLRFNSSTLEALAHLADRHAEPELMDHMFIYAGSDALLEYPDAFVKDCPIYVSPSASEARLQTLAQLTGVELVWIRAA